MYRAFVDLQGFVVDKKEFIVKEFALLSLNDDRIVHLTFKEPHNYWLLSEKARKSVIWTSEYHGMSWESGQAPYTNLTSFVSKHLKQADDCIYYVKGAEKCSWLKKFHRVECVNIENLGCPSLSKLMCKYPVTLRCTAHHQRCAVSHVCLVKRWATLNKAKLH